MDDNGDYRPGLQAVAELHVKSPLRHVELTNRRSVIFQKKWDFRPGTNSPLPVFPHVSFTEKRSQRANFHGRPGRTAASGHGVPSAACPHPRTDGKDRSDAVRIFELMKMQTEKRLFLNSRKSVSAM